MKAILFIVGTLVVLHGVAAVTAIVMAIARARRAQRA